MASIVVAGDTSGTISLTAPAVAGTTTLTLPTTSGNFVTSDSATGGAYIPAGTTAQRPSSPTTGQARYNTTIGQLEVYNGSSWVLSSYAPSYSASYLVVAGGGSGGTQTGTGHYAQGGGGAGGGGSGGTGGSGVVILSVPTANYTGTTTGSPTITTSGSNTIIKFTASGSYTA